MIIFIISITFYLFFIYFVLLYMVFIDLIEAHLGNFYILLFLYIHIIVHTAVCDPNGLNGKKACPFLSYPLKLIPSFYSKLIILLWSDSHYTK